MCFFQIFPVTNVKPQQIKLIPPGVSESTFDIKMGMHSYEEISHSVIMTHLDTQIKAGTVGK